MCKLQKITKIKIDYMYNMYTFDWDTFDKEIINRHTKTNHYNIVLRNINKSDITNYYNTMQLIPDKYKDSFNRHAYSFNEIQLKHFKKMCLTFEHLYELDDIDALNAYKKTFAIYMAKRGAYVHEHNNICLHYRELYHLILFKLNIQFGLDTLIDDDVFKKDIDKHTVYLFNNYGTYYEVGGLQHHKEYYNIRRNILINKILS